jgi:mannose-6-phosphate isomerase-like protein (cupin superfamily)
MEGPAMDKGVRAHGAGAGAIAAEDRLNPFTTEERPWGRWTVLEEGPRYKIKRLEVLPGQRMSLQMHYHRSEHWVVVAGTARVRVGDREVHIHPNQSTFVPAATLHRVENPGNIPLVIIEIRRQDDYGRVPGGNDILQEGTSELYVERKAYGGSRLMRRTPGLDVREGPGRGRGARPAALP